MNSGAFESSLNRCLHPGGLSLTVRMAEVARLDQNSRVLEVGCGAGVSALFLAENYGCKVAGLDLSYRMISLAREGAKGKGLSEQVDFLLADSGMLPFCDSIFDVVISECSFSLLLDKKSAASEIKRVLRPGGQFVFNDIILQHEDDINLQSQVTPTAPDSSFILPCVAGAKSLGGYITILEEVGFQDTFTEDHSVELKKIAFDMAIAFGSLEAFLENLVAKCAISGEAKESHSSKGYQQLFTGKKLGYALVATRRPY